MTIHRNYEFFQETTSIGSLNLCYDKSSKRKLRFIRDQDNKHIKLSQIWIHNISALHIRKFNSSIPPEIGYSCLYIKEKNHYYLDFKGDWSWLSGEKAKIDIRYRWQNTEDKLKDQYSFLKVSGLQNQLEEQIGQLGQWNQYLLYFEGRPLREGMSIGELAAAGIGNKYAIEVFVPMNLKKEPSKQQKATGGSFITIPIFESYIAQMREKIGIVCQIEIFMPTEGKSAYGTGFLIGDSLVMTNHHVINKHLVNNQLSNAKAKFFYHQENHQEEIVVDIAPQVVCFSESPGENQRVYPEALDYAILSLKSEKLSGVQLMTLKKMEEIGKDFYLKAFDTYKDKQSKIESWRNNLVLDDAFQKTLAKNDIKRRKRANIIQHPVLGKISQPKQIAFRDNRAHAVDIILHYLCRTSVGSSGAPVINDAGDWIGVHYSACHEFDKKLFKHVIKLCDKLGYQLNDAKTDHTAFCFTKESQHLYVYRSKEYQGQCSHTAQKDFFSLVELISRNQQIKTPIAAASYIHTFLREQGERIQEDHSFCNTAITVEEIFKDLEKNESEKLKKLEEAIQKTQLQRNKLGTLLALCWANKNYRFAGIVSIAVASLAVFAIIRNRK